MQVVKPLDICRIPTTVGLADLDMVWRDPGPSCFLD